ncbi:hypothetical protein ma156 [Moumouvirus australiensis]|uniref:Uncharacterized protein n=1 Tax=Moumouvirus australiensis TaxID=2109587 RepID=A0A2P1EKW8_9VIRU|nr:hypothetical protein QKC55_gp748 [Moumouvirus australiensis]AVL94542.1 hypothetical protein ma156 [Moumouvirus australiensis]
MDKYLFTKELEGTIERVNKNINEAIIIRKSICKTIVEMTLNSEINDKYVKKVKKLFTIVEKLDKILVEYEYNLNELNELKK